MGKGRDETVPRFFLSRRFGPGPDCPMALSPGSIPGELRDWDWDLDIVPGQPSIPKQRCFGFLGPNRIKLELNEISVWVDSIF